MKKKSVAILGATGMLGSALYHQLKDDYQLVLAVRDPAKIALLERAYGGTARHTILKFDAGEIHQEFLEKKGDSSKSLKRFFDSLKHVDYVINAVGITIPYALEHTGLTFFINGYLPHLLAGRFGGKLIHITTDCVYNGKKGFPYRETSPKTPTDIYGISKSLGEPTACLTLRTSIIGRELEGFTGLLEWFLKQKKNTVKGLANHFWNGVTTRQFAKVCNAIMSRPGVYPKQGLYHIYSTTVSKYDMLRAFRKKFSIDCKIVPERGNRLNRTLATDYQLNRLLKIPSFHQMIEEL